MEYIVSARKYRPMTFATVIGQATLTTTLKNAIRQGKLAHAYLFCGPRGVGKTTCARIFARTINCEHLTADGEACGVCENCRAANEQRSFNIFELDAASNNSVDDIRDLIDQTRIPPQIGRYKVFIVDEVHMLSTAAFNAFLKTLEEPPAHVIFILATTEKHKLLPTILSRCQTYDFERITIYDIVSHLRHVAEQEGYTTDDEALMVIAEKADGAMRDALSIFDQVASYCNGDITYEKTIEDLNVLDIENYFRVVDYALANDVVDILLLLNSVVSKGFDPGHFAQGLARHLRNVMLSVDARTVALLEVSDKQKQQYLSQAQQCAPAFLYKSLQLLNSCEINYRAALNKRFLVELTLIEMAQITTPAQPTIITNQPSVGTRADSTPSPTPATAPATATTKSGSAAQITTEKSSSAPATTAASSTTPPIHEAAKASPPAAHDTISSPAKASNIEAAKETTSEVAAPVAITTTSATATTVAPRAKKRITFGTTFSSMASQETKVATPVTTTTTTPVEPAATETFTDDQLVTEWKLMCSRMQRNKDLKVLAQRLNNVVPTIATFPEVSVTIANDELLSQVKAIDRRILSTLRKALHNSALTVTYHLAEPTEARHRLSPQQALTALTESNPAIELLMDSLNLELA